MTAFVPTGSSIIAGVVYSSVAADNSVTFLQPFTFFSTAGNAVNINHANNTVVNMTTLMSGASYGLVVNAVSGCDIINTATGTIATTAGTFGYDAVSLAGDDNFVMNAGSIFAVNGTGLRFNGVGNIVENSGIIQGRQAGIVAQGSAYTITNSGTIETSTDTATVTVYMAGTGSNKRLVNTGVIQSLAAEDGTAVQVVGANQTTIDNTGMIRSVGGVAIDASSATGGLLLTNAGTISSSDTFTLSVAATSLADTIINTGTINRSVGLGDGDDVFDGIGGIVAGKVFGGDGNDIFRISDPLARVFEGGGEGLADRIETTVSYALDTTGEVENLTLLGTAVHGYGNGLSNTISGNGQDNLLVGRVGNDTVSGDAGDDTLRGNADGDELNGDEGDDSLQGGVGADSLSGGEGDDILRGNTENDSLSGGDGDDMLHGGTGGDTLDGGADADIFLFRFATDSGTGAGLRDDILGFAAGSDLIDLRQIDANSAVTGNQAFAFIGTAAFGSIAGQLRVILGPTSYLQGDVNGDGVTDFAVRFIATATISVNDILL
jgi:Ca2+-binding RTX toxin-like protein